LGWIVFGFGEQSGRTQNGLAAELVGDVGIEALLDSCRDHGFG